MTVHTFEHRRDRRDRKQRNKSRFLAALRNDKPKSGWQIGMANLNRDRLRWDKLSPLNIGMAGEGTPSGDREIC
jgi:hypothetical protein